MLKLKIIVALVALFIIAMIWIFYGFYESVQLDEFAKQKMMEYGAKRTRECANVSWNDLCWEVENEKVRLSIPKKMEFDGDITDIQCIDAVSPDLPFIVFECSEQNTSTCASLMKLELEREIMYCGDL